MKALREEEYELNMNGLTIKPYDEIKGFVANHSGSDDLLTRDIKNHTGGVAGIAGEMMQ